MIASQRFEAIGSVIEIKIDYLDLTSEDVSKLFDSISKELERFEYEYSRFKDDSKLSYLNSHLNKWTDVSEEFIYLIKKSLDYRNKTDGYFDITVKFDLDRIGYDKDYSFKETPKNHSLLKKIHHKIKHTILKPVLVDEKNSKVLIRKEIDFGGIGKGYMLDKIAEIIDSNSVNNSNNSNTISRYYINGGGDILVKGEWSILLEHPDDSKIMLGKIILKDSSVASSAPNRRNWSEGKLHHLINPKTGKPANDMKSVFIRSKYGIDADVYSTSLFAAGFLNAIRLSKKLSKDGIEVMFISKDNQYYVSEGFNAELFGEHK